jgi:nucleotide-binding universal stress UspA family protein
MTSLKSIFAIIGAVGSAECAVKTFQALPLGDRAKLVAVHVSPIAIAYGLVSDMAVAGYIEAEIEAADEQRSAAEADFTEACEQAGIPFEWRAEQGISQVMSPIAGALCRAADLIIFPFVGDGSVGHQRIEDIVFTSGRPVLGVPRAWKGEKLGQRILIAWNGSREAARAAFDAMPFLNQAKSIRIVSVQDSAADPVRQFTPGDDLATTLSRHGVNAESHSLRNIRGSVKEELQSQMLDTGADMVIMGCYGHSRFREMILGGVSRDVLTSLPFPVLLAN